MTYNPVFEEKEISKFHNLFKKKMQKYATDKIKVRLGYQGKESDYIDTVNYSRELDIWWIIAELNNRYGNAFGTGKPKDFQNATIKCEINYPYTGLDLRIAGLFIKNTKNIFIAHSGKIGGGRKGIGKGLFIKNYNNKEFVDVEFDGKIKKYALIADFNSPRFGYQVANFVKEVARIKGTIITGSSVPVSNIKTVFNDEFSGEKTVSKTESIHICDHGLIVKELKSILEEKGFHVANDINRDLYTLDKHNNILYLFEIKTDLSSQSIYKAVGQLFMNSVLLNHKPKHIMVIPAGIDNKIKDILGKLAIELLEYSWKNYKLILHNLDKLI